MSITGEWTVTVCWISTIISDRRGHLTDNVFERYIANGVLSDTQLRWFWVSWTDGVVSYGRGSKPGLDAFGSYNDSMPSPVNYMSVSSYGPGRVYWVIPSQLYHAPGMHVVK